jgi:thiol-disulfide isomerase/thioredoxin
MNRSPRCLFPFSSLVVLVFTGFASADDKPSRVDRLQSIRAEYAKTREDFGKAIQAGTIKPNEDGEYPGWAEVIKQFAKPARALIDADPADAVALDALLFSVNELGVGDIDPGLYQVTLKHHVASEKIDPLIEAKSAPVDFLRAVATQSPHEKIRLWANYHLAENRYAAGKPSEAEPLLEALQSNATAKELGGYTLGTLADTAGRLLFEIRRLSVGQEVPEVTGPDLDGTPLKLSESRGKVTLVVFWATWCGPCMAMVPHERALAERYAGKPFAIVGVNGDILRDANFNVIGADGKVIDYTERVKAAIDENKITWRSFRSGQHGIAADWNVRSWPTVYLVDHRGIIRGKWKGDSGAKDLDAAVEKLVNVAEAEKDQADGRKPKR